VAILNPEHLFEQADALIRPSPAGPPRQVNLRRAISAAYYGIFHAAVTAATDLFIGAVHRGTKQYGLVYRSVDHRWLRELCEQAQKQTLPGRFSAYAPQSGFGSDIAAFATAVIELQEKRHRADCDPLIRVNSADAILAVTTARAALARLQQADPASRQAFLTFLLFRPRPSND
jgi:hypothetical protein